MELDSNAIVGRVLMRGNEQSSAGGSQSVSVIILCFLMLGVNFLSFSRHNPVEET